MHRLVTITIISRAILLFPVKNRATPAIADQVRELLRNRIKAAGMPPKINIGEELIHAQVMLPLF